MIENCMSIATYPEGGISEVSGEWVVAAKDINTETIQIAMLRIMQENVMAAEESPSVAKGIAVESFFRMPWPKTRVELVGSQSGKTQLCSEELLAVDNDRLKKSHDCVLRVRGPGQGERGLGARAGVSPSASVLEPSSGTLREMKYPHPPPQKQKTGWRPVRRAPGGVGSEGTN